MSFLDGLKDKAEEFGEKAKDGLAAAKDKATDLVGDVKDRFDHDETPADPVAGAADHGAMVPGEAAGGIGDAVSAGADPAAAGVPPADSVAETTGSEEDKYDEVLDAAQDKAEALKADPGYPADLGDHRV